VDSHRLASGTAALLALFTLAACTARSTGVTVQSGPATTATASVTVAPRTSSPAVATPPASATTSTGSATPSPSTAPPVVRMSTTTSPPVTASSPASTTADAGKLALDAFLAFERLYTKAQRNPTPANQAAVVNYLTSPSVAGIGADIANQRDAGLVYRGTPDDPRAHVVYPLISHTLVFLRSCPLIDRTSPFLPYFAATGKPALPGGRTGPRWWRDIAVVKVGGVWKIKTYSIDETQPCSA
jgi:hypothetical protein